MVNVVQSPATVTEHFCNSGLSTVFLETSHNYFHQILSLVTIQFDGSMSLDITNNYTQCRKCRDR